LIRPSARNSPRSFALQYLPGRSPGVLVLSRKKDEKIIIGDNITLMVIEIRGDKVRLGIESPLAVPVHRQEVYDAIKRERGSVEPGKD
jgi:carbon storage regulator